MRACLNISWTRRALATPAMARRGLTQRLERLRKYFPEMKPDMTVGITRAFNGLAFQAPDGSAKLMVDMHKSRAEAWRFPTYWTLAHELMHLAQFNTKGIPAGERACDIYALSRLPPKLIDDSPSYLVVPPRIRRTWNRDYARLAHSLALQALRKRKAGLRNYAVWWENEFERRVGGER